MEGEVEEMKMLRREEVQGSEGRAKKKKKTLGIIVSIKRCCLATEGRVRQGTHAENFNCFAKRCEWTFASEENIL